MAVRRPRRKPARRSNAPKRRRAPAGRVAARSNAHRSTARKAPAKRTVAGRGNPKAPTVGVAELSLYREIFPRGTILYGILRSHAASGTRTISFVHVGRDRQIERVPPSVLRAAGIKVNLDKMAGVFPGGGYSAIQEAAELLGKLIYRDGKAFGYDDSYL